MPPPTPPALTTATTRLPFLYPPTLLPPPLRAAFSSSPPGRAARPMPQRAALQPHVVPRPSRLAKHAPGQVVRRAPQPRRRFSNSPCRCRAAFAARHGKAVEPLPSMAAVDKARKQQNAVPGADGGVEKGGVAVSASVSSVSVPTPASPAPSAATLLSGLAPAAPTSPTTPAGAAGGDQGVISAASPVPLSPTLLSSSLSPSLSPSPSSSASVNLGAVRESKADAKMSGPMQAVLYMGLPSNGRQRGFTAPGYVHHFDSYTLVGHLRAGGYTHVQAITAMKAIRGLLAQNLDMAQGTLVSKIDAENESYLFRAACSELGAEVKNNRRTADEEMRQQRILLQHEVDILTQTLNQELLTLTDNVRGMFNDRRMTVREEQRTTEAAIQQLTYQISIELSSDAKSEIESLRWILIRRSVLGIIFMAVLTLGTLRYATYLSHERQKEADRKKKEKEERWRHDGMKDQSSAPDAAVILAAS